MNPLSFAASTLRISVPYGAGALGGTLSERAGVVNIALEGLMLAGAFAFATTSWWVAGALGADGADTARWLAPLAGLGAAAATAFLLSLVHAWACVTLRADNIISGLAINIFALGATNFLLKRIFGSSSQSPRVPTFSNWELFDSDSLLAPVNQMLHPLILLVVVMIAVSAFVLRRTRFGLRLRAVGENPHAADSLGVNVAFYRYWGVLLGGTVASVGGVWLASDQGLFSSAMTNGRGYIALAAMIVGKWRPWGAAAASLLFGFVEAGQNQLQVFRQGVRGLPPEQLGFLGRIAAEVPTQLVQAFPFILTIVIIAGVIGRSTPPAADGVPFEKENG
jgi:simple sugar transport system permease protein